MRGKPATAAVTAAAARITPADAGKTLPFCNISFSLKDHPRGCGENGAYALAIRTPIGSPPRMRGKQERAVGIVQQSRITPADAGKTLQTNVKQFPCKDHPRGCGENAAHKWAYQTVMGSPPRMRGKLLAKLDELQTERITPADAGKTAAYSAGLTKRQDHPRGCGENRPCSGSP